MISDFIKDGYDYPNVDQLTEFKTDSDICYVNSTYCIGLANILENISAFMIARYSLVDDMDLEDTVSLDDNDELLQKYIENINYLNKISDSDWYHTKLGHFCIDDVIITGESENNYYIVWFDHDVSDCEIIKINKEHYQSLKEFNDAVIEHFEKEKHYKIKPIRQPAGWFKW